MRSQQLESPNRDPPGPYEILSLLGAGGMGEVYEARDTRLEREVAMEYLHGETVENA